jgi:hypothetical protein
MCVCCEGELSNTGHVGPQPEVKFVLLLISFPRCDVAYTQLLDIWTKETRNVGNPNRAKKLRRRSAACLKSFSPIPKGPAINLTMRFQIGAGGGSSPIGSE